MKFGRFGLVAGALLGLILMSACGLRMGDQIRRAFGEPYEAFAAAARIFIEVFEGVREDLGLGLAPCWVEFEADRGVAPLFSPAPLETPLDVLASRAQAQGVPNEGQ